MSEPEIEADKDLGKRVAEGALWMTGAKACARLISAIRLILVAALLPQDQIGLFGLAAVAMHLLDQLSRTGMQVALIQRKGEIQEYLGTAWVTQAIRGVVLSIGTLLLAGHTEAFFGKPGVASLLYVLAVVPLFLGIENISLARLHRELRFRKVVGIQVGTAMVDLLICLLLAFQSPTALALVWGRVGGAIFSVAASFVLERRRFKPSFSLVRFRELYAFGFWIFVSAVLSFITVRGGDIVVGKLLSVEDLAIYQIAYVMACAPIMEIMGAMGGTALPAYSQLQDQAARLSSAFLRILAASSFIASLSIGGFAVLGSDFCALFFRPEYSAMAGLLLPLAIWGGCRGLGSTNSVLFQAIGRPALATVFQFLMVFLFVVVLIPCASRYGLKGTVYPLAAIGLTAQALRYWLVVRVVKIPGSELFARLVIPLGVGALSALVAGLTISLIPTDLHALRLVIGVCVFLPSFFLLALWSEDRFQFGLREFAQRVVPKRFAFLHPKDVGHQA